MLGPPAGLMAGAAGAGVSGATMVSAVTQDLVIASGETRTYTQNDDLGIADFTIRLDGLHTLSGGDFVL